ncbi:MAG: polysaccharide biosynthesis protein [Prochlorococcus sp.]|jgi:FlaA1/EpsC-like NDP-sugar epimerase|nr:nucleoside-diphosphate sugar epimerase/dehydratase [Prochlorococcaceae cyanobacterium ETNP18_MAG_1]HJM80399.1 nucleoside-diphosphate sugar epimerase/dehydratase [Prochlorococcaceae cyanobacterium Fu_MAG_72]|tara:strand:- start:2008 stop:3966 length:1959 start_codon:yes stop_codon:yes gene_type:complete
MNNLLNLQPKVGVSFLLASSPFTRRLLLIGVDVLLLPMSVWLSFWLRLAHPFSRAFLTAGLWMLPAVLLIGLPLYVITGQYKGLTRCVGSRSLYRLAIRNGLLVLCLAVIGILLRLPMPPRSSWILLWLLLTGLTGVVRFTLRDLLLSLRSVDSKPLVGVAIYGAGAAGAQLSAALRSAGNHRVTIFLDDAPALWGRTINGIPIQPPQVLSKQPGRVDQVLLAIPSLPRQERRRIVADLQRYDVPVLQIPSVDDLTSGRAQIDALRPVAIEDLLGRDPVPPLSELLGPGLRDAVVCVTGAGGSIGAELCRQILQFSPRQLILLESSEPSLYALDQELRQLSSAPIRLLPVLGSAANLVLLEHVFHEHAVQTVFHAAAYKHVPLVEANPLAGLANNVGSTRAVCRAASEAGVSEVVLISTDKAVRPTNVMGASKRLAELVVQASAAAEATDAAHRNGYLRTRFAMVRFGNVLGSSGSVVPLFRSQIASGGPITLTHPDIIRYFMTIPEAVQLVLQASALAEGADLFLLDMGDPVRIKDLAEQMVRFSGLSLRDAQNPGGEIEIICTGLRPGEKLYEELLIDAESEATKHPRIFRSHEHSIPPEQLWSQLDALEAALAVHDQKAALGLLALLVPEWKPGHDFAVTRAEASLKAG